MDLYVSIIGCIYIIKNRINEKVYIGQTTLPIGERFGCHMKPSTEKKNQNRKLYNAIKKYGRENFYVEILEDNIMLDDLDTREIYYIALYDSYVNGYNSTRGGDGRIFNAINNEEELLYLASQGVSAPELAEKYGVHKGTILRTLHKLDFHYYKLVDEKTLKKLIDKGYKNKEIAAYFNVDDHTITRVRKKHNLQANRERIGNRDSFDIDSFKIDYKSGMDRAEICKKYDLSMTSMQRLATSYSLKNNKTIRSSEITKDIYLSYVAGTPVKELVEKYGINEKAIYARIEWYRNKSKKLCY